MWRPRGGKASSQWRIKPKMSIFSMLSLLGIVTSNRKAEMNDCLFCICIRWSFTGKGLPSQSLFDVYGTHPFTARAKAIFLDDNGGAFHESHKRSYKTISSQTRILSSLLSEGEILRDFFSKHGKSLRYSYSSTRIAKNWRNFGGPFWWSLSRRKN